VENGKILVPNWRWLIFSSFCVTGVLFLVQLLGVFQPLEWKVYDWFFQIRPLEPKDKRIVIVGMTESDIRKYGHPISDRDLARLIEKIKAQTPEWIGLDLVRDRPVGKGTDELNRVFETTPKLIGVEKIIGNKDERIAPPPVLKKKDRVAIADVEIDKDGVLRRGIYHLGKDRANYFSLGAALADFYLKKRGYTPRLTPDGRGTQWGNVRFFPFQENDGGYQRNYLNLINSQSDRDSDRNFYMTQYLVNFRNPIQSFERVSFSQILEESIEPNLFRDKIVLIGMTAISIKDEFYTPFSFSFNTSPRPVHGVEFQANFISHIISAVLDGRSIIKVIPEWIELGLVLFLGSLTATSIWKLRRTVNYFLLATKILGITGFLSVLLVVASYLAFVWGWWMPVFFPLLEILAISTTTSGLILYWKNQELKAVQEQLIFEKKRAALAGLLAGVAHGLNNPLNAIILFSDNIIDAALRIRENLELRLQGNEEEAFAEIELDSEQIEQKSQRILQYGDKSKRIIQRFLHQFQGESLEPKLIKINDEIDLMLNIASYGKQAETNNFCIAIETSYDTEVGTREVILEDLYEILMNLIYNACDELIEVFEKKQQRGEEFKPTLKVSTQMLAKNWLEIVVSDNGEGVDSSIANEIFKSFKTTKQHGRGTGLGLYFVYGLVKKNQGEVTWHRKNGFTEFVVRLPVSKKVSENQD
jgi:adenylate cyclase